jgi:hypothetical protein
MTFVPKVVHVNHERANAFHTSESLTEVETAAAFDPKITPCIRTRTRVDSAEVVAVVVGSRGGRESVQSNSVDP